MRRVAAPHQRAAHGSNVARGQPHSQRGEETEAVAEPGAGTGAGTAEAVAEPGACTADGGAADEGGRSARKGAWPGGEGSRGGEATAEKEGPAAASKPSPIVLLAVALLFGGAALHTHDFWFGYPLMVVGWSLGMFCFGVAVGSHYTDDVVS